MLTAKLKDLRRSKLEAIVSPQVDRRQSMRFVEMELQEVDNGEKNDAETTLFLANLKVTRRSEHFI